MKQIFILFLLLMISSACNESTSSEKHDENNIENYFPLQIGNSWVIHTTSLKIIFKIEKSTLFDEQKYFQLTTYADGILKSKNWIRFEKNTIVSLDLEKNTKYSLSELSAEQSNYEHISKQKNFDSLVSYPISGDYFFLLSGLFKKYDNPLEIFNEKRLTITTSFGDETSNKYRNVVYLCGIGPYIIYTRNETFYLLEAVINNKKYVIT